MVAVEAARLPSLKITVASNINVHDSDHHFLFTRERQLYHDVTYGRQGGSHVAGLEIVVPPSRN